MIISPQGKIVAEAQGPDGLAIADIDPRGQREGGDAMNWQRDMRARLFRERNPEAFQLLLEPHPPVLDKVPIGITAEEAGRVMARALTVGEEEFKEADALVRQGKNREAIQAFEQLRTRYPGTWIERRSQERLAQLRPRSAKSDAEPTTATASSVSNASDVSTAQPGLAGRYPGDVGLAQDSAVLFADDFESGDMK